MRDVIVSGHLLIECDGPDVAQRAVRPNVVVMVSPVADDALRIGQILKPVLVWTTISEASVEAFNKRVLSRLAWLDEVQLDTAFLPPEERDFASHLRAVIEHQRT